MKELEKPGKADDSQAEESMTAAPEGEKAGPEETGMPSEAGEVRSDVGSTAPEDRKDEPSVETLRAEIEAILFSLGESVDIAVIADAVGLSRAETEKVLKDMQQRYEAADRGIRLIRLEDRYQLSTKKELYPTLIKVVRQPQKTTLTDVLMETLSIVAYRQPVTRTEIEKIRGVKCDHAINKLVEYNLIQEVGRLDAPGRPILFGTTEEFLRHFGTDSVDDLPAMNPVKVEDFKAEAEEEANVRLGV
ncbi:MAG: SMC-Scp complex subunit ScpB [Porcincola intestinalis]|nr:SMC-Scp complex subunit ScpB [Porcincola intestinalis]MDY5283047.1 SMC-Scp complex subunit ScpB [Porcincola intestinalis]